MQSQRKAYVYQNRTVYEWDEGLDTVSCFIELPPLPPQVKVANVLSVVIKPKQLTIGFKDTPPYLKHELQGIVDSEESLWYIGDKKDNKGAKEVIIELQKAQKGVRWGCIFKGHSNLNIMEEEQLKKKLLLERFQE